MEVSIDQMLYFRSNTLCYETYLFQFISMLSLTKAAILAKA